jgi:inner membrane protein
VASIFSHPAVPVAIALALGRKTVPVPLMQMGVIASVLPDLDCLGFALGIPYASQFGHRGFTHSIVFALAFASLCAWRMPKEDGGLGRQTVFAYIFASALSHPLIDMLTDGGKGIALFWPFTTARLFFPVQPIPVSPIGARFFSAHGLYVFTSELALLWAPCLSLAWLGRRIRPPVPS